MCSMRMSDTRLIDCFHVFTCLRTCPVWVPGAVE